MAEVNSVLALDVGSTTTKATLWDRREGRLRFAGRTDAPTTVELPTEDVMIGVREAIARLEEEVGRRLMAGEQLVIPQRGDEGVDLCVVTSSAGGGLQMSVAGIMREMTAESAHRAALGAGAVVMDVMSIDDGRLTVEKVRRLKELRPDMILLSGGTDGGNISQVMALAEIVSAARPRPRFGSGQKLPLIYAGNVQARPEVERILGEEFDLRVVPNIRPRMEEEVLEPARREIQRVFLESVIAQAPGYSELLRWSNRTLAPTPAAVGKILRLWAEKYRMNVLAVDVGGATTDVFSVINGQFTRTVSANVGMTYSSLTTFTRTTAENVLRWIPFDISEDQLRNWNANKMIQPTTLPQTLDELLLEQALAREAVQLAFADHLELAVGLKGIRLRRGIADIFEQTRTGMPLVDLLRVDAIVATGGVMSHAPRPQQALAMLLDGIQPEGVTELYVDNHFMLPHLGILAEGAQDTALQLLEAECLIHLGTCIAPVGQPRSGSVAFTAQLIWPEGKEETLTVRWGEFYRLPLGPGEVVQAKLRPARNCDLGEGRGRIVNTKVEGGVGGLIIDARGRRPVPLAQTRAERVRELIKVMRILDCLPEDALRRYEEAVT